MVMEERHHDLCLHHRQVSYTLILCLQMILSFELPFALIPLLKFTSSKTKMGAYVNSIAVKTITSFPDLRLRCYLS